MEGADKSLLSYGQIKTTISSSALNQVVHHLHLMSDAGLITETERKYRLTNSGHDLLVAMRDEGIWQKTKEAVAQSGGNATLDIVKQIAVGFLKKTISERTGIDL